MPATDAPAQFANTVSRSTTMAQMRPFQEHEAYISTSDKSFYMLSAAAVVLAAMLFTLIIFG